MSRLTFVILGLLAGFFVARLTTSPGAGAVQTEVVRDIVAVPAMSDSAASAHREDHFARITSIEQVLALPSDFAQSEALYAMAGRASADELQRLIFDADRIANEPDRQGALFILFAKLAEVDPASALAVARTPGFEHDRALREMVWSAWARSDLEAALTAANAQAGRGVKALAAAGIYAAHGYLGNDTTDRIQATLDIAPDRSTRNRFLHTLISRSPAQAAAWIDGLPGGKIRDEYIWWFAYEMSNREGTGASQYARLFRHERDSRQYLSGVERRAGVVNPRTTIERFLASGNMSDQQAQVALHGAISQLAATDLESAIAYLGQGRNDDEQILMGGAIAAEYAARNPADALAWARATDSTGQLWLVHRVLRKIAETDPRFAIGEALASADQASGVRDATQLIQSISQHQPAEAASYVDLVPAGRERARMERQLADNWLQQDADAALDWILSRGTLASSRLLNGMASSVINTDLDAAIRVLPRLNEEHQRKWRRQIVDYMGKHRPPAATEAFLRRFAGEPDHEQLESLYVTSLAASDPSRAQRLADQIASPEHRAAAYAAVIEHTARQNPRQAAAMLSSISDDAKRAQAGASIVSAWHRQDASGAQAWVTSLPRGELRDFAIRRLAQHWTSPTEQQLALAEDIDSERARQSIRRRLVYLLWNKDPQTARRLLDEMNLSASDRANLESVVEQAASGNR